MIEPIMIEFLWNSMTAGVVGNSTYDAIKASLGKGFDALSTYVAEDRESDFNIAMSAILLTNEKLLNELQEIRRGKEQLPPMKQTHKGTGDIIGGDKVIYNNIHQEESLEDKQTNKNKYNFEKIIKFNSFLMGIKTSDIRELNQGLKNQDAGRFEKAMGVDFQAYNNVKNEFEKYKYYLSKECRINIEYKIENTQPDNKLSEYYFSRTDQDLNIPMPKEINNIYLDYYKEVLISLYFIKETIREELEHAKQ